MSNNMNNVIFAEMIANDQISYSNEASDKKRTSDESLVLASLLDSLNEATKSASSNLAPTNNASSNGVNTSQYIAALGLCAEIVTLLQISSAKAKMNETEINNSISASTMQMMQTVQQQAEKNLQQIQAEINAENNKPWWETLLTVLTFVAAAITMVIDPAAGAIMLVLATLSVTGALQDLTSDIAQSLVKDGLSQDAANMVASIIMTVAITVVSMGSGFGGASLTGLADDTATITQSTARAFASKILNALTNKATFLALSGIANGIQSSSLMTNVATYIIDNDPSYENNPEKKAKALEIVAILQAVVCVLLTVDSAAGLYGISKLSNGAEDLSVGAKIGSLIQSGLSTAYSKISTFLTQQLGTITTTTADTIEDSAKAASATKALLNSIYTWIKDNGLTTTRNLMNLSVSAGNTGVGVRQGSIQIEIADLTAASGLLQGMLALLNNNMSNVSNVNQNQTQQFTSLEKSQAKDLTSMLESAEITSSAMAQAILAAV